ncbi:hypothetical protein HMPREF9371_1255 [Neisseria shayeganii 871]|uniref:Uncharacterized protein n=1 Tax=Neisseria shayeganii 871 TaxID=1032488 RepID=G4CI16_9NEIS|nr:hypothetical protein HMPREF9371_1255 [Neisseria shayeganii 871]
MGAAIVLTDVEAKFLLVGHSIRSQPDLLRAAYSRSDWPW